MDVTARRDQSWIFVTMSGFTTPCTVARYDFSELDEAKRWSIYRTTKLQSLDLNDFSAEQVWYKSLDGTEIPMFLVRHKSTPTDGTAPAYQYGKLSFKGALALKTPLMLSRIGYGGFTVSLTPFFSATMMTFLLNFRAVLAVPNLRGGGEFGEEWHLAGTKERKVSKYT